jgi:hypothetical protein
MKEINIKPIKLTPKQSIELMLLCEKTWLATEFWWVGSSICFHEDTTIKIHWFEFVVRMAIDEELDEFMNFYLNVCSPDETSANK